MALATATLLATASPAAADFRAGETAYAQGNYQAAIAEFAPLAARGDPAAQFYLGVIYAKGLGVAKDSGVAHRWFACAAERARDAELRTGARRWRDQSGAVLTAEARERVAQWVKTDCLAAAGDATASVVFAPHRETWFETVIFFVGDLSVAGLLTVSNLTGTTAIGATVGTLIRTFGDWFVGVISLFWWLLAFRVLLVIFGHRGFDKRDLARFADERRRLEDLIIPPSVSSHSEDGGP
jgi:hypothetical protein